MPTDDPVFTTLARLVDHERWPSAWMPDVCRDTFGILWRWHASLSHWLPDPDDAATGGVLLASLPAGSEAAQFSDRWRVLLPGFGYFRGFTLGRACVSALASAWGVE